MTCQKCASERTARVSGKVSDLFSLSTDFGEPVHHEGYVPSDAGIGGGNSISFTYCLDCGHIHGHWPAKINLAALDRKQCCGLSDS